MYAEGQTDKESRGSMTHPAAATPRTSARVLVASAMAAALVLASSSSAAQGALTLYGGARGGGELVDRNAGDAAIKLASGGTASVSFDWLLADGRQAQIFYSFQRSALPGSVLKRPSDIAVAISYLHAGGRVFFDGGHDSNGSYLVGGLGITHLSPSLEGCRPRCARR
jgi:hypothetical protein